MNKFITFEGIDGSGKSTILNRVKKQLKSQGFEVISTFEPTDSWLGKYVKKCIETDSDPFVTSFTFISDRIEHCRKIQKWLDEDKIVLCDRYADSTYAYQGAQFQGIMKNPIRWLKELSDERILMPDRTFVFIIDPEKSIARIKNKDKLISFEQISFLKKVHKNYLKLAVGDQFYKLDATKTIEELEKICCEHILI